MGSSANIARGPSEAVAPGSEWLLQTQRRVDPQQPLSFPDSALSELDALSKTDVRTVLGC